MNIELERQAFEAWADQQWPGAKRQQLERDEYGQYKNAIYRDFWTGWQARATRPAQTEQQPEQDDSLNMEPEGANAYLVVDPEDNYHICYVVRSKDQALQQASGGLLAFGPITQGGNS